jgi:hypothetical protein
MGGEAIPAPSRSPGWVAACSGLFFRVHHHIEVDALPLARPVHGTARWLQDAKGWRKILAAKSRPRTRFRPSERKQLRWFRHKVKVARRS